jgi:hypothetical protein
MHTKCQKRAFWRVIRSAQQCAELSQYTTGMEKCKQKVEKKDNFVKNISNRKFGGSMVYLEEIREEG